MNHEVVKQNFVGMARSYVVSLLGVADCGNPVSIKFWCCGTRIISGHNPSMDDGMV